MKTNMELRKKHILNININMSNGITKETKVVLTDVIKNTSGMYNQGQIMSLTC